MSGWSAQDYGIAQTSGAVLANNPISKEYPITADGAKYCAIKVTVTGVTVVGAITAKLQTAIGSDWVDSKTVSITATGSFYIKILSEAAADQSFLPLLNKGRVVVSSTNAGDVYTVASVEVLQAL